MQVLLNVALVLFIYFNFYLYEIGSHYVAHAGLELEIFLSQPPEWWDYKYMWPCLASFINILITYSFLKFIFRDKVSLCYSV
jgi:hypothetical protein